MASRLRSLYICYLSLEDPLVHTQVVAYLAGLVARGHSVHLLTYDPPLPETRRSELDSAMRAQGIVWHSRRYHKSPSLPATIYDALSGAVHAVRLIRRHGLEAVHARNHVPAVTALLARTLTGCRLIFDLRGLMAEEYVDAGAWKRGGVPFRITEWIQRKAIADCDAMVMLTESVRRQLFGGYPPPWTHVIPCCTDIARVERHLGDREAVRADLGIDSRLVIVYVGKFGGRYGEREMVEFFTVVRAARKDLLFLVVTQADPELIRRELVAAGIDEQDYRLTSSAPETIGRFLSAADVAIAFYRHAQSAVAASPTKTGEYLAAGLPLVTTSKVGDVDALLHASRVGVVVDDFTPASYRAAADEALALLRDPETPERCRAAARENLSLDEVGRPRYDAVYEHVAALLSP
jgi:glycosyltransferase involved in cell wall biosynthesis